MITIFLRNLHEIWKDLLRKSSKLFAKKSKIRNILATAHYFLVNNPKLERFYLPLEIHRRLQNVPGQPVMANSGYCMRNISALVECPLEPLAQKAKFYIKVTNGFFS